MPFDLAAFIRESNRIDPQYDLSGRRIPGDVPGDPMYDNMRRAFELAQELAQREQFPSGVACDLHRELTRGIDAFEARGMSGRYRECEVWIGGQKAPAPYQVRPLMEETWLPQVNAFLTIDFEQGGSETDWWRIPTGRACVAWWAHDCFECIHPFVDGNGRTGRLLLNLVRLRLGLEPLVIYYDQRHAYYAHIQHFRDHKFSTFCEQSVPL